MFGARNRVSSRMYRSCPATKDRPTSDSPSPSASTVAPSVPRKLQWMWHELPSRASNLAMKVSAMPSWAAISLAPFL